MTKVSAAKNQVKWFGGNRVDYKPKHCICNQCILLVLYLLSFFCTGVQCGSVFVFSVFRAVHTDRKVSGGERRKRDTTDLATQDEQEQYKGKRGEKVLEKNEGKSPSIKS